MVRGPGFNSPEPRLKCMGQSFMGAEHTQMCVQGKHRCVCGEHTDVRAGETGSGTCSTGFPRYACGGDPALSGAKKAGGWLGLGLGLRESGAGARLPPPTPKFKMWVQKENFVKTFRSKLSIKTFRSKRFGQNLLAPKPLTISINPKP